MKLRDYCLLLLLSMVVVVAMATNDQVVSPHGLNLLPGQAEYIEAVEHLFVNFNFTGAVEVLRQSAKKGYADAMSLMAVLYSHGMGVPQSEAKALVYHTFAAAAGSAESNLALGHRFEHGIGVVRSCDTAVKHVKAAADVVAKNYGSDIRGKVEMVDLEKEHSGAGEEKSLDSNIVSLHYFQADQGAVTSKMFLGYAHLLGLRGVGQDGQMAISYFEEALKSGEAAAHGALGQIYSQGVKNSNPPIEQDPEKALYHFQQGAEREHPVSLNGLGYIYAKGDGVEQDFATAARYFERSAATDNSEGMYNLGVLHLNGKGVRRDYKAATQLFLRAAAGGSVLANWQLGGLNMQGLGQLPRSCTAALRNFRLVTERGPWNNRLTAAHAAYHKSNFLSALIDYLVVAEMGLPIGRKNAVFLLNQELGLDGIEFLRGKESLSSDDARNAIMLSLLRRSAQEGNEDAHLKLGDHYYYGIGAKIDYKKAEEHYLIAAAGRNPQALFNLGVLHESGDLEGVRQDFHLSKRYYDMALESDQAAYYAVKASLIHLNFHWWLKHYAEASGGLFSAFIPAPFGIPLDTLILFVALGLVAILLLLRHHAVD